MAILDQASTILSSPTGSTAYYFLLLLAVGAGLWMAWSEWRRARSEHAQRWLVAMGGVVAVRVIFVLASLVASLGWIDRAVLLPPLERFVDLASISFLAWALLPWAWRRARGWDWFFGVNLVLAIAACVTFAILWAGELASNSSLNYNSYWQATVWAAWQLALVLVAALSVIIDRGAGWGMYLPATVLLFVGTLLQLLACLL